jgi:hypothetical protein
MLSRVAIVPTGLLQSTAATSKGAQTSLLLRYNVFRNMLFSTAGNSDGAALHVKCSARQKQAMPTSAWICLLCFSECTTTTYNNQSLRSALGNGGVQMKVANSHVPCHVTSWLAMPGIYAKYAARLSNPAYDQAWLAEAHRALSASPSHNTTPIVGPLPRQAGLSS